MILPPIAAVGLVSELAAASSTTVALDHFLRALTVDFLECFQARAAVVLRLEPDLRIAVASHFGVIPSALSSIESLHYLRESPFSSGFSEARPLVFPGAVLGLGVRDASYTVLVPIPVRGNPNGCLAVWLGVDPQVSEQEVFWSAVGLTAGLALNLSSPGNREPRRPNHERKVVLSSRQLSILELVAADLTNREIARHLNYGVSTIGHELMEVFSLLGVDRRKLAVQEAARLGILTRTPVHYTRTEPILSTVAR